MLACFGKLGGIYPQESKSPLSTEGSFSTLSLRGDGSPSIRKDLDWFPSAPANKLLKLERGQAAFAGWLRLGSEDT